jgi:hypothetical protein
MYGDERSTKKRRLTAALALIPLHFSSTRERTTLEFRFSIGPYIRRSHTTDITPIILQCTPLE